jgi:hypothetical protein
VNKTKPIVPNYKFNIILAVLITALFLWWAVPNMIQYSNPINILFWVPAAIEAVASYATFKMADQDGHKWVRALGVLLAMIVIGTPFIMGLSRQGAVRPFASTFNISGLVWAIMLMYREIKNWKSGDKTLKDVKRLPRSFLIFLTVISIVIVIGLLVIAVALALSLSYPLFY